MALVFKTSGGHDKDMILNVDFSDVTFVTEDRKQMKSHKNSRFKNFIKS